MKTTTTGAGEIPAQIKLFRLPKIAGAKPKFSIPNFEPNPACVNCKKSLKNESEFSQKVKVCAGCLLIHSVIDDALTGYAGRKAIGAKRQGFIQRLNFDEVV